MKTEQPPPSYNEVNSSHAFSPQPPSYSSAIQYTEKQNSQAILTSQYPSQLPIGTGYSSGFGLAHSGFGLPVNQGYNVGLAGATQHQSFQQIPVTNMVSVNISPDLQKQQQRKTCAKITVAFFIVLFFLAMLNFFSKNYNN